MVVRLFSHEIPGNDLRPGWVNFQVWLKRPYRVKGQALEEERTPYFVLFPNSFNLLASIERSLAVESLKLASKNLINWMVLLR